MFDVIGKAAQAHKLKLEEDNAQQQRRVADEREAALEIPIPTPYPADFGEAARIKASQDTVGWHIHPNRGQSRALFREFDYDSGESDDERRRDIESGIDDFAKASLHTPKP